MNKTFKVVYNRARSGMTAVSEMARSMQGKGAKTVIAVGLAGLVASGIAWAEDAKLVVKVNRLIKVFHFYGDLYQAVQNALSDGGTVIRHQQNLLRLRISFVRLIDIRYHAERAQTLDTPLLQLQVPPHSPLFLPDCSALPAGFDIQLYPIFSPQYISDCFSS